MLFRSVSQSRYNQAGLTMKSGDTKPVSNTKVVLTKIGIPQICKTWKVFMDGPDGGKNFTEQWAGAAMLAGWMPDRKQQLLTINQALAMEKVAEDTTDFNGQAVFASLPIRRVYANVLTELGGGGGASPSTSPWSVPIDLKPGENKLILSNDNLYLDYN